MPELPEVEHSRRVIERVASGRKVVEVEIAADPIVFPEGADAIADALRGRAITAVHRRGKWMWIELSPDGPALLIHLGMSGAIRHPDDAPLALESSPKNPDRSWPPRFTKLRVRLHDGAEFAFTDPRRLGRAMLRNDAAHVDPIAKLGFDPYLTMPTAGEFARLLARRRGVLKGLLLDQTFAAGVGNWIADEVLYHARLHPEREVQSLDAKEVGRLRTAIGRVVRTAVAADADSDRYPKTWLFHHRWGRAKDAQTARGERIEHLVVAGRTTAYVPARQHRK